MKKREQARYLKRVVTTCITAVIIFTAASYVTAWFGVNTVPALTITAGVLGGNLVVTCVIRLNDDKKTKNEE